MLNKASRAADRGSSVDMLDASTFANRYLLPGRPVLVRKALTTWGSPPPWSLSAPAQRFEGQRVLLCET